MTETINTLDKKQKKKVEAENIKREQEIAPIAKKILQLIAQAELPMGTVHAHEYATTDAIAKEVLGIMLESNTRFMDKDFLFQMVIQPIDQVREVVSRSLKKSLDRAIDVALGKPFIDIRLKDLDEIIKSPVGTPSKKEIAEA